MGQEGRIGVQPIGSEAAWLCHPSSTKWGSIYCVPVSIRGGEIWIRKALITAFAQESFAVYEKFKIHVEITWVHWCLLGRFTKAGDLFQRNTWLCDGMHVCAQISWPSYDSDDILTKWMLKEMVPRVHTILKDETAEEEPVIVTYLEYSAVAMHEPFC